MISRAMWASVSLISTSSTHFKARRTDSDVNSLIEIPPISTARDSGRSLEPSQAGQAATAMNSSIRSRIASESVSR